MAQPPIDSHRTALVIFDMVNAFVHSSNPERARQARESGIVERCADITEAARAAGIRVFYANSEHRTNGEDYAPTLVDADHDLVPYPDGPQRMDNPPPFEGTTGAEIIDELRPRPEDYTLTKRRWSAFVGTPLDILLRGLGIDTILLVGGSTDIGIVATAYSARDLGYNLVILRDACGTHRPGAQEFCMDRLFPRMARVMDVAEAISLIE